MAERPRELDQRFQVGVNLRLHYRLKGYFVTFHAIAT